ncbi:MAG TPA: two-component system response regulator [Lachnospiraceae bacterium]|nr:response regulator [Lachnospiraceae bacterium]HAL32205.1 two-component system response regulator [Lachnospiraceae bacterium]HBB59734.1 two-component system response regulator [Lachnospiraceae bacterium]HCR99199.1 two-component system response regulator [Lachnospiraceae bacterium]
MKAKDLKVMICDDSMLARKNLINVLKKCGVDNVIQVSDGQAAVDTYKAEKPDIVLLDVVMPVKDGITALKEIMEFDSAAVAVMVSSVGTQMHIREAVKTGARDFLQKPASLEQITSVVERVVREKSE